MDSDGWGVGEGKGEMEGAMGVGGVGRLGDGE